MEEWKLARLYKAQYRIIGHHSAVKVCHWTKQVLRTGVPCYKQTFYGIKTAQCMEMTPALTCNQRCLHCWRDTSIFSEPKWTGPVDDPKFIIKKGIEERKKLLIGFRGNKKVDQELLEKAMNPVQAAISLTGEPCLYPRIDELIEEFFNQGFETVFLVTNGTVPEALEKIKKNVLPTNLYISLTASDPEMYKKLCLPLIPDGWERLQKSLEIMSTMHTNTVIRLTLINGLNMQDPQAYLPHIEKAKPKYIECKAYMHVGYSKYRLTEAHMPTMEQVRAFAEALEENSSYKIANERADSRIVLLKRS